MKQRFDITLDMVMTHCKKLLETQESYFKHRKQADLHRSKELEAILRRWVRDYFDKQQKLPFK